MSQSSSLLIRGLLIFSALKTDKFTFPKELERYYANTSVQEHISIKSLKGKLDNSNSSFIDWKTFSNKMFFEEK